MMKEVIQTELRALEVPAACKFCETIVERDIVLGQGSTTICYRCIYRANKVQKTFPEEAIYCFKCKSFRNGFKVGYASTARNPKSVVTFSFLELDCKGRPVYGVVRASAPWEAKTSQPIHANCNKCKKSIPLWMLSMNSYMKAYNLEPNDKVGK